MSAAGPGKAPVGSGPWAGRRAGRPSNTVGGTRKIADSEAAAAAAAAAAASESEFPSQSRAGPAVSTGPVMGVIAVTGP
jgi:hypothetical protein